MDVAAATQPVVMTGGGEDKGRFQTALLTLGATHTHFGHVKEALTSLNETVRLGHCVRHAHLRTSPHGLQMAAIAWDVLQKPGETGSLRMQVRIAQQNTDTECLIHALASLCALLSTTSLCAEDLAAGRPMRSDREHLTELLRLLKRRGLAIGRVTIRVTFSIKYRSRLE